MNNVHFQNRGRMLWNSIIIVSYLLMSAGISFAQNNSKKILLVVDDSKPIEVQNMPDDVDIKIDGKGNHRFRMATHFGFINNDIEKVIKAIKFVLEK